MNIPGLRTARVEYKAFEDRLVERMPKAQESSRRMQHALGIDVGTKMVPGKCWEMPKPARINKGNSDGGDGDNDDFDDRDDNATESKGDAGHYDDGIYEGEGFSNWTPEPSEKSMVYEEDDEESDDDLSSAADVRTVDRVNTGSCMFVRQDKSIRMKKVVPNVANQDDRVGYSDSEDELSSAADVRTTIHDDVKMLDNITSQSRGRRMSEASPRESATKKPKIDIASNPVRAEPTKTLGAVRARPHDLNLARIGNNHANDLLAIPSVRIVGASPRPNLGLGLSLPGMPTYRSGIKEYAPVPAAASLNAIKSWISALPPFENTVNPYEETRAELTNMAEPTMPIVPPGEKVLKFPAPIQSQSIAVSQTSRPMQLEPKLPPYPDRSAAEPTANYSSQMAQRITAAKDTRPEISCITKSTPYQAPGLPPNQPYKATMQNISNSTLCDPATPPPAYQSPPRIAGRLEAPVYWNSSLSTTIYSWLRHTDTKAVQTNLQSISFGRLPKAQPPQAASFPSPPESPGRLLCFDARHFAKVKIIRILLPEAVRSGLRNPAERDWFVIEMMSDTPNHAGPTLARDRPVPNANPPIASSTTKPDDKPYWLLAFPVLAVTAGHSKPIFTGHGIWQHTRVHVGKEGLLPVMHGRTVDPWFLEDFLAACSQGEGMIETTSENKWPI